MHPWNLSPVEAQTVQRDLAQQVIRQGQLPAIQRVTGVDASYKDGSARAAVVTLNYPDLTLLEYAVAQRPISFPYISGLLSFREGPPVLDALAKLSHAPQLLIFDGQGIAHPRRLGLASHIGVLVDIPSIGCAKSRLCGTYQPPGPAKGDFSDLTAKGETIGAVLRTRTNIKPLFVSIGHRVDLPTAIHYVLSCCTRYRLPETTRWADKVAGGK